MNTPGMRARIGMMVIGLLGFWSIAEGKVVYVAKAGSDANDGLSWAMAKVTVQAGLNASVAGDEVWVAAGTYVERITLTAQVALYGGFVGSETGLAERDWKVNATILDGNANGSVVISPWTASSDTRIDGFIIRNGNADKGGGIRCEDYSSPTITNNTITGNSAYSGGGGVYCSNSSSVIADNTITGNIASGASASNGGGISCYWNSSATIANNTITGNSAYSGGGGVYCFNSSPVIVDNTITGNIASGASASNGGGISCYWNSSATIANNTVKGNSASGSYSEGGGIYCVASSPTIINNAITGNSATGTSYGLGGGIHCHSNSFPTITNNTITGNNASGSSASQGGGICCINASPTITNTTVAFNSSGLYVDSSPGSAAPFLRYNCVVGNAAYNYSGLADPTGSDGNISADPLFIRTPTPGADGTWATADDDPGNLHLKAGSPCIDAGDNAAVPAGILTDLDGLLRFIDDPATPDTGLGTAPIVDMGAYEYVPGDYDRDGDIDADDMAVFAACVSGPAIPYTGDCAGADFDRDGDVDQSDFGLLQRWLSGTKK